MEAFKFQKKLNFGGDVKILERLAAQGVNILGIVPLTGGDSEEFGAEKLIFMFEYLYRTCNGHTNWRKAVLEWHLTNSNLREGLCYVGEVASELQSRLGQEAEC